MERGLAVIFRIDELLIIFFDLPKQMLKSIFLVRHRKTSIIRKNQYFPDYRGFPVPTEKNGLQIWNLHPKKHLLKK